jgi:hypothetical protein
MELVYSTQKSGFEPGKMYRNPQHFERPELGVTSVTVVGDWPTVVGAHEEAGIEVLVVDAPKVAVVGGGIDSALFDAIKRDLEAVGLIVESLPSGELHQPEEGDTALRLFAALVQVSTNIQDLVNERDGLIAKRDELDQLNAQLLSEIQELKDAAAKQLSDASEVDAMKAKLDAAGVSYRANASKESLEKLVADLPSA